MVTVTIMGVLVGMSAPYFGRALEQSRADFAVANLRAIWAAQRLFWLENHAYTDKITQESPKGLRELGLLDRAIKTSSEGGDYTYEITTSADGSTFSAKATRAAGTGWTGWFTINQDGTTAGSISAGTTTITPGFQ
jgi:Tfp pilus assembly protein PilE